MAIQKRRTRYGMSYGVSVYVRGTRTWIDTVYDEDEAKLLEINSKRARVRRQETVASFADRWLQDFNRTTRNGKPRWGRKSVQTMAYALRPFTRSFGSTKLRDLTVSDIRPWAGQHPYNDVKVAKTMLADAVRDGLAERNPFSQLRLEVPEGRRNITVLTEAEIEDACEKALGIHGEYGTTFAAILATAAYTAIRPGELAALEPGDIRPASMEVDIRQSFNGLELKTPKNGKPRMGIILPPHASRRIAAMPRHLHSRWLFTNKSGGQLRRETIHRYWDPVRAAIGHAGLDFYELRHAGATLLIERENELADVAWQLGHKDTYLVERLYGHPRDEWRRERIKRTFVEPTPIRSTAESSAAEA